MQTIDLPFHTGDLVGSAGTGSNSVGLTVGFSVGDNVGFKVGLNVGDCQSHNK